MAQTEDLRDVGLAIILLRSLCNWSQAELSRQSGVDKSLISDYELGKSRPSARTRKRLAEAVDVESAFFDQLVAHARGLRAAYEQALRRQGRMDAPAEAAAIALEEKIARAALEGMAPYLLQLSQYDSEPLPGAEDATWPNPQDTWPET